MTTFTVYSAGGLFSLSELTFNQKLAAAIELHSDGMFKIVLPQDTEMKLRGDESDALHIRDHDILGVVSADLCICNFDGTEADSGTVVEFMIAMMLGIGTIIHRTDFRNAGDQHEGNDPFNLMMSNWPRSNSVWQNAMESYRHHHGHGDMAIVDLAQKLINRLMLLTGGPPPVIAARDQLGLYMHVLTQAGVKITDYVDQDPYVWLRTLIEQKREKGLLSAQ